MANAFKPEHDISAGPLGLISVADAVVGSRHWHRDVPNCACCCEMVLVSLWLRLLKKS